MTALELDRLYDAYAAGLFHYFVSFAKTEADARLRGPAAWRTQGGEEDRVAGPHTPGAARMFHGCKTAAWTSRNFQSWRIWLLMPNLNWPQSLSSGRQGLMGCLRTFTNRVEGAWGAAWPLSSPSRNRNGLGRLAKSKKIRPSVIWTSGATDDSDLWPLLFDGWAKDHRPRSDWPSAGSIHHWVIAPPARDSQL